MRKRAFVGSRRFNKNNAKGDMTVLEEIISWSKDRPAWQQEALRRFLTHEELSDDDVRELTEICKGSHGLAEVRKILPLAKSDIPASSGKSGQMTLISIFHHQGVNALAEDQTLKFAPHLTVVYGDNGAGKTGYIRILKSACRARGAEQILGNVVSGRAPPKPSTSIKYLVAGEEKPREWTGDGASEPVGRVSVFDTYSAGVYLREKTDVAFRPFGLDLFDRLVRACKAVKIRLESEQRAVAAPTEIPFQVPENTAAGKLLAGISSLTNPDRVKSLGTLAEAESSRLQLLQNKVLDLQANDPAKLSKQLGLRGDRIRLLSNQLKQADALLSEKGIAELFAVKMDVANKSGHAERLRKVTFPSTLLAGTGSEHWASMWKAAETFSMEHAYPAHAFPNTAHDARCVLCQQGLAQDARERLQNFQSFVISAAEKELIEARQHYQVLQRRITDLTVSPEGFHSHIEELRIESDDLANETAAHVARLAEIRSSLLAALAATPVDTPMLPSIHSSAGKVETLAAQLTDRAKALLRDTGDEQRKAISDELQELKARETLGKNMQWALDEIERKKKVAAYGLCLDETKTQAITQKSTIVTRAAVTERLTKSFIDELSLLEFKHIEVELREAGGDQGNLYHKLVLKRAPGVNVPKIVSEGEARCLSIAAFFAELSTAEDASGIVFDDPVSSLDYRWRENVARRLVEEAKRRQVVVFTHDVVFLLHLHQFAKEQEVEHLDQYVRQLSKGAGVSSEELPWVALPVKKRVGQLKNLWQEADKIFRGGHQSTYEKEAKHIYGLLRETWERAIEEVLLGGVVERYRPSIETKRLPKIADISDADCKTLEIGMSKCSRWLTGHDQAAAARAEVPEPAELKADIETLEGWIAAINRRRG